MTCSTFLQWKYIVERHHFQVASHHFALLLLRFISLELLKFYSLFSRLIPGKDNGVTSTSDGRALQETTLDVPSPAAFAGLRPDTKLQQHSALAWPQIPMERDSSHDSMVSSTSNLPSSSESRGSDAASVLLYQSSNSGKDPRLWNVQEVTNFMYSIGCSNYADAFVKEVCVCRAH